MEKLMPITGECFCAAVKYQVDGKLHDGKSCHCSRCRKAFNAQASAVACVQPGEFTWLAGEELLTSYVGEHGYGLQFCSICGSTLSTIYKDQVIQVSLGCVNGQPDIEIDQHVFVGSKANWELMPEGVTAFEQWPPDNV
jgi:hypothetical protein